MALVDPDVTNRKLDHEIELWNEHADEYRRRGWLLLERRGLRVDVGFLAEIPLGPQSLTAMTACVRFDFADYDLSPPSVEFIDPITGEYATPIVPAVMPTDEGPRNMLVGSHPETDRPFFCVPGVRQYHDHPQHSGDSWLLHRANREGSLVGICDRIWRSMARSVLGLRIGLMTLPAATGQPGQMEFQVVTGDIDALLAGIPILPGAQASQ